MTVLNTLNPLDTTDDWNPSPPLPPAAHRTLAFVAGTRPRRVSALLVAVAALSAMDLALTLGFMQTVGMFEDNPIVLHLVRWAESATAPVLAAYKTLTVLTAVGLLYALRHRVQGEVGAWVAVAILGCVCFQWAQYSSDVLDLDPALMRLAASSDAHWVALN